MFSKGDLNVRDGNDLIAVDIVTGSFSENIGV